MPIKEVPPSLIPTQAHALNFLRLEGIHGDASHETNVHAQAAVDASATEADKDAEFGGCPLWGGRVAICAAIVGVGLLDIEELEERGN